MGGDLDGAPIRLESCVDKDSESWEFENPTVFPRIDDSTHNAMNFWPAVLGLSFGAWLGQWLTNSFGAAAAQGSSVDQGAVALTTRFDKSARDLAPAIMALNPMAAEHVRADVQMS